MAFLAEMPHQHGHEIWVALRREDGKRVTYGPQHEPRDPLLKPEAERGSHSAVHNRNGTRRTAKKDRLDERAVHRRLEAFDMGAGRGHEMSAPPPKLKKLRKKDDAAKAIDRPKTIWMRRRKPPAVSPNASVSPVTIMMITATIFATGP